jgi:hypothetical protein
MVIDTPSSKRQPPREGRKLKNYNPQGKSAVVLRDSFSTICWI